MIRVIKKDGTKEDFNVQKVVVAVNKSAYRALINFTDEVGLYLSFRRRKGTDIGNSGRPDCRDA